MFFTQPVKNTYENYLVYNTSRSLSGSYRYFIKL